MKKLIFLLALLTPTLGAFSADFGIQGKIIRLEPTFSDHLNIRTDTAAGACPAGTWLYFFGAGTTDTEKKASVKHVYAGLLSSMYAGKNVALYGNDQGCLVTQVHLVNE